MFLPLRSCLIAGRGKLREDADLDDPQPPLDGIGDEEAPLGPHGLVLLHHEPGDLPQALLVVGVRAEVDNIGGEAGHAALAERGAVGLFRFRVHAVHHVDGELELLALDLSLQLLREPRLELDPAALGVVTLDEDFLAVGEVDGGDAGGVGALEDAGGAGAAASAVRLRLVGHRGVGHDDGS